MKVVKLFLKTFIGGSLLIFGPIVFIAMIVGEEYLIAFCTLVLIIAFFALSGWDNQRGKKGTDLFFDEHSGLGAAASRHVSLFMR